MNTIKSTWYGWGVLCVAGGGAYYFAKQQINADKKSRFEEEMRRKSRMAKLESSAYREASTSTKKAEKKPVNTDSESAPTKMRGLDHAGSPSSEISEDAAPVGHAPVDDHQKMRERSKYEAAEPYRSKKGDRFS